MPAPISASSPVVPTALAEPAPIGPPPPAPAVVTIEPVHGGLVGLFAVSLDAGGKLRDLNDCKKP